MQGSKFYIAENSKEYCSVPVLIVSIPEPLQLLHFVALVPGSALVPLHFGQVSTMFTSISLLIPRAAWENVSSTVT